MAFELPAGRPLIMGIINVTPDSFSGDGVLTQKDYIAAAVEQAARMAAEGADLLDIGGESTRPGATPISAEEEIRRVIPVISAIRKKLGVAPALSIDTTKAAVAEAALAAGAAIINDISALCADPLMTELAARQGCPVILMHNRSDPASVTEDARTGGHYHAAAYGDVVEDVKRELAERAAAARAAGIAAENIIVDPGIGFGKSAGQNLALINHLDRLKTLGFPVLVGPSRKSFIGQLLNVPVEERLEGTAALVAIAALRGADIIRVHDVGFMSRVARMAALVRDRF